MLDVICLLVRVKLYHFLYLKKNHRKIYIFFKRFSSEIKILNTENEKKKKKMKMQLQKNILTKNTKTSYFKVQNKRLRINVLNVYMLRKAWKTVRSSKLI